MNLSMDKAQDDNDKFSKGMLTLSLLGIGSMIGTVLIGKVIDKKGYRAAVVTNQIVLLSALFFLYSFISG